MFLDVDAEPFGVIFHTEGDPALSQDHRDHKCAPGCEAIGHQNGLQLTKDQGESSVLSQDGSGGMGGNQRSACEDAGQKPPRCHQRHGRRRCRASRQNAGAS